MGPTPGILYVTMQPDGKLPVAQFHDWYNNEHGPTRLRLPFVENGFRYRATDLDGPGKGMPEWMAIYDIADTAELTKETYTRLREDGVKSRREKDAMKQIAVDRRIFTLVKSWEAKDFKRLENITMGGEENVLIAVSLSLFPEKGNEEELTKWYDEEHVDLLSKVPGWLRTRRFVTSPVDGRKEIEYLALHEYAPHNGLGGEEFVAATTTPWNNRIMTEVVQEKRRRTYELYYIFGAAPRDLSSLASKEAVAFTSPDAQTKTLSNKHNPAVESYVTTKDGVVMPYRLEGSADPHAPLIVLSNSILVDWGIWDGFLESFFSGRQSRHYRVLRYLTRGRSKACGDINITLDVLASDITALLDALRISKTYTLIGVSLGGATVLNAALKYPERVTSFISCDTNAKSPPTNKKTWEERIAIAEAEGATSQSGLAVVGEKLAELTVRRWFIKESYDGGKMEAEIGRIKGMVQNNSLRGFKKSVEALYDYDMSSAMKECTIKAAFVVGSGDGVLPGAMKEMAAQTGGGAEYMVVGGAGHLPMVEKPEDFAGLVTEFLNRG